MHNLKECDIEKATVSVLISRHNLQIYPLQKQSNLKCHINFLKFLSAFTDGLKNTTSSLQSDIDEYETNQLKISAAISSLELFRMNQTVSKCGKESFYKV